MRLLERGGPNPLIARDDKSKVVFGHVVPSKGIDEWFSADSFVEVVKWLGYLS